MSVLTGHGFTQDDSDALSGLRKGRLFPRSRFFTARGYPQRGRRARVFREYSKNRARGTRLAGHTAAEKAGTRERVVAPGGPSSLRGTSFIRSAPKTPSPAGSNVSLRREDFAALVHVLETQGHFAPAPPDLPWADPRPDLVADHARWLTLLELAYRRDGTDPYGVFGALVGIRCCGAAITSSGGANPTWRLTRGELTVAEWQTMRAKWLMPHLAVLQELLGAPAGGIRKSRENGTPSAPAAMREAAPQP